MSVESKVVEVTPKLAEMWLKKNTKNRGIRSHLLGRYAQDMKDGLWRLTGEPIIFNCDGTLIDGQHRLRAVIEAGKAIKMVVVEGVDADSFEVVDSGASRKAHDAIAIKGLKRNVEISSMTRRIVLFETGGSAAAFSMNRSSVSTAKIMSYVDEHASRLIGAIDAVSALHDFRMTPVPKGLLFFLYYVMTKNNKSKFLDFAQAVVNGEGVMRGDPAFMLRRNLLGRSSTQRPDARTLAALTIKSWNAHYEGKPIETYLVWKGTEEFPEIKGAA